MEGATKVIDLMAEVGEEGLEGVRSKEVSSNIGISSCIFSNMGFIGQ